jgi:hypothetical protein
LINGLRKSVNKKAGFLKIFALTVFSFNLTEVLPNLQGRSRREKEGGPFFKTMLHYLMTGKIRVKNTGVNHDR